MGRFKRWYLDHPGEVMAFCVVITFLALLFGLPHLITE